MRLLNVEALDLELREFFGDRIPPYAILSHTWGDDEVTFQDLQSGQYKYKAGFTKIQYTCQQPKQDGLLWCWVDTCCIDKSSSAELSEAINSMFNWYARANICYAYLVDATSPDPKSCHDDSFKLSRWFSRGWTLQELIAPRCLQFYDALWNYLGERDKELLEPVYSRTGLDSSILGHPKSLRYLPIARRVSWMADRKTTRVEDQAYCMLGIFGVNLPLLYGEESMAFRRLQKELVRRFHDHSLFVFSDPSWGVTRRMFATSPAMFADSANLDHDETFREMYASSPYTLTNHGIRISLPLINIEYRSANGLSCTLDLAVLNCRIRDYPVGLFLLRELQNNNSRESGGSSFYVYNDVDDVAIRDHGIVPVTDANAIWGESVGLIPEEIAVTAHVEELLIMDKLARYPSANSMSSDYRNLWFRYDSQLQYHSASPRYISGKTVAKLRGRLTPHMIQLKGFLADIYTTSIIKFSPPLDPQVSVVVVVGKASAYDMNSPDIRAKLAVVEGQTEVGDADFENIGSALLKQDMKLVECHMSARCIASTDLCGHARLELWYEPPSSPTRPHHLLTLRFASSEVSTIEDVEQRKLSDGTLY